MARNEEKHYGRLNRLLLHKEKEEYEKNHPQRPRLDYLETVVEIQEWLPSIKQDLDFYLKKSQVVCYSDEHIEECKIKVNKLEKEYKAFVRKIAQLTPGKLDAVPWNNRSYKRKSTDPVEEPTSRKEFKPLPTPILDKETVSVKKTCDPMKIMPHMDEPLSFASSKGSSLGNVHETQFCENQDLRKSLNSCSSSKTINSDKNKNSSVNVSHFVNTANVNSAYSHTSCLVNYGDSSDSDS